MMIDNCSDNILMVKLDPEPGIRKQLDRLMELIREGSTADVLIDFSDVDIMTSLSLSGFLQLRKLLNIAGHRLVFCNCSNMTKDIFHVTCFDDIFEFIDDKEEAIEALERSRIRDN